jgi:hypothetical protein
VYQSSLFFSQCLSQSTFRLNIDRWNSWVLIFFSLNHVSIEMGLGFLLCWRSPKTTSSKDLAVRSATVASQMDSMVVVQDQGLPPEAIIHQPIDCPPSINSGHNTNSTQSQSHEEAQGQEEQHLPPQAIIHQPIDCPANMRRYSFSELSEATNSFNEDRNKRGVGAFGMVFEGQLPDRTRVAVKRRNPKSEQGRRVRNRDSALFKPEPPQCGFPPRLLRRREGDDFGV